jgi:NADH-quinone oxidoreductase subunit L
MADYLFLIPLLPLLAFVINFVFGRSLIRNQAHWIACPAVFASFALSVAAFFDVRDKGEPIDQHLFTWIPSGDFNVDVSLHVDQLTAIMLLVVTSVSFLVHVYSIGYMHGDGGYYRFLSYLPLFVFSMLMLVLADNFLLLFVFWEAVGLCSYLLIGYYFKRRSANNAAKKAFIVNRIGDLGFGLGIMWIFSAFGTLKFFGPDGVFALAEAGAVSDRTLTGIGLLLFTGAMGKSAQFPLHVWLPDAMEGPTPVSALIHAATMVTAGIYMIARSHAIVQESQTAMFVIATIGAFTAFMAATIALTQNDIKRVVAYSTVSQLGYMAFGLGTGLFASGIFHLMTHAFFKGLLFLGCGAVIHGMHEEQNIQNMGGLRKYMPITFWTFLIGALANAGLVPLAGFWSKDELIAGAWTSPVFPNWGKVIAIVGLAAAFLTALYMFRLVFLTFFGRERFDTHELHPHEAGPTMTVPLVLLAIPSILIGFVGFPPDEGRFHKFIEPVFAAGHEAEAAVSNQVASLYILQESTPAEEEEHQDDAVGEEAAGDEHAAGTAEEHAHEISNTTKWTFGIISSVVALTGIFIAYLTYIRGTISATAMGRRFSGLYQFLYDRWRIDEFYDRTFIQPSKRLAMYSWRVIDVGIIDATVNGLAGVVNGTSARLRTVQTGLVANYALAIALGMVVIIGVYFAAFSDLLR